MEPMKLFALARQLFMRTLITAIPLLVGLIELSVIIGCVRTKDFRDANGLIIPNSIATMETVTIGGISQSIWFRGIDTNKPALILLHGGPGTNESALFRHYNAALEEHFLVVYWEQRGTGRSYSNDIPQESMTIAQFVIDLDGVVELVRSRFRKDKVILLGHSWGTVLGTIYASTYSDKVAAYVGVGQVADGPKGERFSYDFALAQAIQRNDWNALHELKRIGPPPHSVDAMLALRKWSERFGGAFHGELSTGKLIWTALQTDEANVIDLIKFGQGNRFSLTHLWLEFSSLRLKHQYRSFDVPILFMLGRHDQIIPSVLAEEYFHEIQAPCKQLVWFEQSAHNPPFEEPDKFNEIMIHQVLPLVVGLSDK